MPELKEQEEKISFLISRIEAEASKFEELLNVIESKEKQIKNSLENEKLGLVPVKLSPHSQQYDSLKKDLREHLEELNRVCNSLKQKLNLILEEELLIKKLKTAFGEKVKVIKNVSGDFEIIYSDENTISVYNQIKASKQLLQKLREDLAKEQ